MNRQRKAIIEANKVSTVEEFILGGYPQKVLIEGKTKDLPVVITLHGGPGSPIPFCVGARGFSASAQEACFPNLRINVFLCLGINTAAVSIMQSCPTIYLLMTL